MAVATSGPSDRLASALVATWPRNTKVHARLIRPVQAGAACTDRQSHAERHVRGDAKTVHSSVDKNVPQADYAQEAPEASNVFMRNLVLSNV